MKKILGLLLGVIFIPFMIFMNVMTDKDTGGAFFRLWEHGNLMRKIVFVLLAPLMFFLFVFGYVFFEMWEKLLE